MYLQRVSILEATGDQLSLGHLKDPHQFPPTVLAAIEGGEPLKAALQLVIGKQSVDK